MNRSVISIGISLLLLLLANPALACTGCWGPFPRGTNFKFLRMRIQNEASYPKVSPAAQIPTPKGEAVPKLAPQKQTSDKKDKRDRTNADSATKRKQKL